MVDTYTEVQAVLQIISQMCNGPSGSVIGSPVLVGCHAGSVDLHRFPGHFSCEPQDGIIAQESVANGNMYLLYLALRVRK